MNETVLDAAVTTLLAMAKRLHPAESCLGVILSPGTGNNTWSCSILGAEGKVNPMKGNGASPTAAYGDLMQQFRTKIKDRWDEDEKALALSTRANTVVATVARA